ncbi:MAG TPA: hypothetical protein DEF06_05220 [Clostridiales bacterium]|jgi:hypothetical protein|nr:hypothetical protein [Clostridiales bacterium]
MPSRFWIYYIINRRQGTRAYHRLLPPSSQNIKRIKEALVPELSKTTAKSGDALMNFPMLSFLKEMEDDARKETCRPDDLAAFLELS